MAVVPSTLSGALGSAGSTNCKLTFFAVPVLPKFPLAVTWLPTKTVPNRTIETYSGRVVGGYRLSITAGVGAASQANSKFC